MGTEVEAKRSVRLPAGMEAGGTRLGGARVKNA